LHLRQCKYNLKERCDCDIPFLYGFIVELVELVRLVDCQSSKTVVHGLPSMLPKMRNKTMKMMMKMERPKMPRRELIMSKIILVDSLTKQPVPTGWPSFTSASASGFACSSISGKARTYNTNGGWSDLSSI